MAGGLGLAVLSAASFGLSGALARGLLDAGWSAGAAVAARVTIAAVVLAVPTLALLRGRWPLLRRSAGTVVVYGLVAVAGCQFAYFEAVGSMTIAVALLLEYTAPVAVVGWLWLRHGERPRPATVAGAVLAAAGLVLVLGVLDGVSVSTAGLLWALGAMAGAATYFMLSAEESHGLPPLVLAGGGLLTAAVALGLLGLVGAVPMHATTRAVRYDGHLVAWWLPLLGLGVVSAALAYVTGIAASRRLGSRLASFVALGEVLAALVFAWLLLGELPRAVQLLGGVLVLAGVVLVRLGEGQAVAVPVSVDPSTVLPARR
ncbi:MAG: EamA family transporter [Marmoricola sp.]